MRPSPCLLSTHSVLRSYEGVTCCGSAPVLEVADDLERARIDLIHRVAFAVGYVDAGRKPARDRAQPVGAIGGIDIVPRQGRGDARSFAMPMRANDACLPAVRVRAAGCEDCDCKQRKRKPSHHEAALANRTRSQAWPLRSLPPSSTIRPRVVAAPTSDRATGSRPAFRTRPAVRLHGPDAGSCRVERGAAAP